MIGSLLFLHQSKAADYYLMFAVCPMEVDVGESAFPVSSGIQRAPSIPKFTYLPQNKIMAQQITQRKQQGKPSMSLTYIQLAKLKFHRASTAIHKLQE